jgi:hypothetical protein
MGGITEIPMEKTFKMYIGINYAGSDTPTNFEFNPDSAHQCGSIIGKLVDDEIDAINFQILIQQEDKGEDVHSSS